MSQLEHQSGLIRIKSHDAWQGDIYLTERLTLSPHKAQAGHFSLFKETGTTILNGDRISIYFGGRVLAIVNASTRPQLVDMARISSEIHSFIISSGSDIPDPVTYDSNYCLVVDLETGLGLKSGRLDQWKAEMGLLVGSLADPDPRRIQAYQFSLERVGEPITLTDDPRLQLRAPVATEALDGNKGLILIFLLMIILILCIIIGNP